MMTHEFKPYLYLLPGKGYVAGNGCIDEDGTVIALHMVSHSADHPKDIPGTQITYIRPTPKFLPYEVRIRIDRMKSSAVLQAIDAKQAMEILRKRGRTIEEIAQHKKTFGITVLRERDIDDFLPKERAAGASKPSSAPPTKAPAARRK